MARHMRPEERDDEHTLNPRSASDLLREAGYDAPDTRRRRRRDRTEESSLPSPPERMMFPYRRDNDAERERSHPPAPAPVARIAPPPPPPPTRQEPVGYPARPEPVRGERVPSEPAHGGWARPPHATAEQLRAEQFRAEQLRAEQLRAEQARAEQLRAEQARVEQFRAEQLRAERLRAEQARAEQARTEQLRAEHARAEQARAEQARTEQLRAEHARAERAEAERVQAERARAPRPGDGRRQRTAPPPAGRWLPDQTGPQTGPHSWPPLAPVPDLDEPTQGDLRRLPAREHPEPPAGRRTAAVPARRPAGTPARPAGRSVAAAAPKRAVPPEYDDRLLERPAGNAGRSRAVELAQDEADAPDRSLLRDWVMFLVETLLAAALGLGLWLGFHILWGYQPLLAAAGSGLVLVGLHVIAGWVRRRQTGGDMDLFTSAVVIAVGVAITVLPAAFTTHPGG